MIRSKPKSVHSCIPLLLVLAATICGNRFHDIPTDVDETVDLSTNAVPVNAVTIQEPQDSAVGRWLTRLNTAHGEVVIQFEVREEDGHLVVLNLDDPNHEPANAGFEDGILTFERKQRLFDHDLALNFELQIDEEQLAGTLRFQVVGGGMNGERKVICERVIPDLGTLVDEYLEPYLATRNFSGTVLIGKEDQVLFRKGYGFADHDQGVANEPQTVFHLCSVSRTFTSAAILLLQQQGKLSVNDRLSKYFPEWPRGDEITIHHLLTLSAGFPNINTLPGYMSWSMSPQTPSSLCEKFRGLPLEFEPGTKSVHSNSNYNVLALLIEEVSQKTYGQFLRDEFFAPLEMTQTAHDDHSDQLVPHEAIGYLPTGRTGIGLMPTPDWSVKTGNGSLYSTVDDLYKFDRMLTHNRLLDEAATEQLFAEHFPANGYGWFVSKESAVTRVNISGRSPGFGAYWVREIEPDITVIVLGNLYSSATIKIGNELLRIAKGEPIETPTLRLAPLPSESLRDFPGAFQFGPDFYRPNGIVRVRIKDGHLVDGRNAWLIPAGDDRFIHRIYWSNLEFVRDRSGKVMELRYDSYTGKKME